MSSSRLAVPGRDRPESSGLPPGAPAEGAADELIAGHFNDSSEYWTAIYAVGDERAPWYGSVFMRQRMSLVLSAVDDRFGRRVGRILDAGCGTGFFLRALAERGHTVVGVDTSDGMLSVAADTAGRWAQCGTVVLLKSDVRQLQFETGSFDAAISVGVLEYVSTLDSAIAELHRVVRPGGLLVVTFPNLFKLGHLLDPYYYTVRALAYVASKVRGARRAQVPREPNAVARNAGFYCRRFTRAEIDRRFRRHGCRQVARHNVCFGPPTFWRHDLLGRRATLALSGSLCRLSRRRGFSWLGALADRWVFVYEKPAS